MTRAEVLKIILETLEGSIEPAVAASEARGKLALVKQVLAYLVAEAEPGGDSEDTIAVAWRYFEPDYRVRDAGFDALLAETGRMDEVVALLTREKAGIDGIVAASPVKLGAGQGTVAEDRPTIDVAALQALLRIQLAEPHLTIADFRPFADGRSKLTGLLKVAESAVLPEDTVLRMDLAVSATQAPSVSREFDLLVLLHGHGLAVPKPLFRHLGPPPLGAPFMLMTKVAGAPASGLMGPPFSGDVARTLAAVLAKLHRVPVDGIGDALETIAPPSRAALLAELDGYEDTWRRHDPEPSFAMRYALRWLRERIELADWGPPALTHRDPLFHNVMADGDRMTALLDWEFVRVGYPAEDLGWIRAAVEGTIAWDDFMACYRAAGGHDIPAAVVDFYALWGAVRLGSMFTYSNWLLSSGRVRSIDYCSAGLREGQIGRQWLAGHVARVAG